MAAKHVGHAAPPASQLLRQIGRGRDSIATVDRFRLVTGELLAVLGRMPEPSIKDWALSKITVENGKFVHESVSTYFSQEGALNAYSRLLGIDAPYEETIDDWC